MAMDKKILYSGGLLFFITLLLVACQPVRVDSEPVSFLGSARFVVSDSSCMKLLARGALLPLDMYYAGSCYEQGHGVGYSAEKAEEYYITAARWGVPEAIRALERLGKPIPDPDLLKRQIETGDEINRQHQNARKNQLEQEKARAIRDSYWLSPPCYGYHCWPRYHRCRHW